MKNFKKFLSIGLAAITAMSVMSITSFAEIVKPLPNGGEFVIYEEGDVLPPAAYSRTADFTFSQTFPMYPSHEQLRTPYSFNNINNVIPLSSGESNILFHFNSDPSGCYVWLYDVSAGVYELEGEYMGMYASRDFGFRNFPSGTAYKVRFSGTRNSAVTLSGSCETY